MLQDTKKALLHWLKSHPGLFHFIEENQSLKILEVFSQKDLSIRWSSISKIEIKTNSVNPQENYLIILFENQNQLVLCSQGFAFPPNFSNSGFLQLPNPVYCFQDFHSLMNRLKHVAAEEDRRKEALELILILIAILDGAKQIGFSVGREEEEVETILSQIEKGKAMPSPH